MGKIRWVLIMYSTVIKYLGWSCSMKPYSVLTRLDARESNFTDFEVLVWAISCRCLISMYSRFPQNLASFCADAGLTCVLTSGLLQANVRPGSLKSSVLYFHPSSSEGHSMYMCLFLCKNFVMCSWILKLILWLLVLWADGIAERLVLEIDPWDMAERLWRVWSSEGVTYVVALWSNICMEFVSGDIFWTQA